MDGGILGLLVLIRDHRGALEYDFRTRFQLALTDIGESINLLEAIRLVRQLRVDPSTALAAALEGWKYPISREALLLADLFDLSQTTGGVKKPKAHPGRPWDDPGKVQHFGSTKGHTPAEMRELLRKARLGVLAAKTAAKKTAKKVARKRPAKKVAVKRATTKAPAKKVAKKVPPKKK